MISQSPLSTLDWIVIVVYLVISLALGLWYARQGNQGFLDFILSGRKLSWWLAGTSVVATTFSVDTPLYVTELVRSQGIAGNWQWWCMGIGGTMGVLAVTYFAARWRRAEVVTEVEFVELRYSGQSAAFLRGFKAVFFALVKNTLNMATLLLAMGTVLKVNVGFEDGRWGAWTAAGIAFVYTLFGGLWGVVLTDFFQFVVAMIGATVLAYFALDAVGGIGSLQESLATMGRAGSTSFFPDGEGSLVPILLFVYLGFTWWANPNADGGGMFVQRMAACKDEKHAIGGSLWAIFAHYTLRSWPWILAALVSIVVLPLASDREAYPLLVNQFLPSGWRGLMVVSFLAAFMSTVSTQLNWGASVLVNDLYKRFVAPQRSDRHYILMTQAAILLLILLPMPLAAGDWGVRDLVERILGLGAGFGPVLIARWIWWRTNAWSEVSAILASSAATALFLFLPEAKVFAGACLGGESAAYQTAGILLGTMILSAAIWVPVTLLTAPVPGDVLRVFCDRLQPLGFWGGYHKLADRRVFSHELGKWALGVTFLFSSLFAVGYLCLGEFFWGGSLLLGSAGLGLLFIRRVLPRS